MQAHDVDRIKNDARDYTVYCGWCNQKFEAKRSDASFCSARCRVNSHREPARIKALCEDLVRQGRAHKNTAQSYSKSKSVYLAMQELRDALNVALTYFENEV